MNYFFKYIIMFLALIIIQVLVCNHILLFGVAAPVIFVYFIIALPIKMPVKGVLTLGFLLGFIIDIFSDTPGVNTLACTIIAIFRRPIFELYISKDDIKTNYEPSIKTMGFLNYLKYSITILSLYCLMMFGLEYFSLTYMGRIIACGLSSAILSLLLIVGINSLLSSKDV